MAVAIVPWTLLMLFNACWLRMFLQLHAHGVWGESQIAMACTWQSAEASGCNGFDLTVSDTVTVRHRLFKYSLGTC